MKAKIILFLIISLYFLGCATAPPLRQIQNSWQIDQPFDTVWQAAIEVLPEMQLTIAQTEKESGLITTNPIDLPTGDRAYCDWGKLSWTQSQKGLRGKYTIYVKKIGDAQTELKMVSVYEILFDDSMDRAADRTDRTIYKRACVSTGKMEADFYSKIQARFK